MSFSISDLISISVPYRVHVLENGDEVAQRTTEMVLHLMSRIDVWISLSSNESRAEALDVLGKSYSYLFAGSQLDSCQLIPEEIQDYRNECYAHRKQLAANGGRLKRKQEQQEQQSTSLWSRIANRITQPSAAGDSTDQASSGLAQRAPKATAELTMNGTTHVLAEPRSAVANEFDEQR